MHVFPFSARMKTMTEAQFLPTTTSEMNRRGWDSIDILFVSGDAYVDHPSFAAALLGRLFESHGYRVGIVAQPRWDRPDDFQIFGVPRLCCMISSGNIDSMVSNYTSARKKRTDDAYSAAGKGGKRPDRALITYSHRARQALGQQVPIIIGGIEGSLRRFAHYDYWSDMVRRSILLDAKADLLVYGMGELQCLQILKRLDQGESIASITDVSGTVVNLSGTTDTSSLIMLPSYEQVSMRDEKSNTPSPEGKRLYAQATAIQMLYENPFDPTKVGQRSGDRLIVMNPPARPVTQQEFDTIHTLAYTRRWHPQYDKQGGVPALAEVQFSITSNRGCFGSCTFCAITSHQGRMITNRSIASLVQETKEIVALPHFKGNIHDVGGPTANFQDLACNRQKTLGPCQKKYCLDPTPCSLLLDSHPAYLKRLEAVKEVKGVKRVFIRSGIRYDYLLQVADAKTRSLFINRLATKHTSGQLRVAPEHCDPQSLSVMGKPPIELYEQFVNAFNLASTQAGKQQYCIPYFIAAHPGTTLDAAIDLAHYIRQSGFIPQQVQQFYPTPGTAATCMYYSGLDPRPGKNFAPVYVPKGKEAAMQRALMQFNRKENRRLVTEALVLAKRTDEKSLLFGRRLPQKPKRGRAFS